MTDQPLFVSAHAAMVFAFNFASDCYDRPIMNRLADGPRAAGKGLAGLDGAAQAGMVRAEVAALGRLAEAIIIARIAPRSTPCSCKSACCSGKRANKEWLAAISVISDHMRTTALAGCTSHGLMRREYVVRYFAGKDQRRNLEELAEHYKIDRKTISAHCGKVSFALGGSPARNGVSAVTGLEHAAMDAAEERLRACGMVGAA